MKVKAGTFFKMIQVNAILPDKQEEGDTYYLTRQDRALHQLPQFQMEFFISHEKVVLIEILFYELESRTFPVSCI